MVTQFLTTTDMLSMDASTGMRKRRYHDRNGSMLNPHRREYPAGRPILYVFVYILGSFLK